VLSIDFLSFFLWPYVCIRPSVTSNTAPAPNAPTACSALSQELVLLRCPMLLRVALPLLAMVHANLESRSRSALGKEAVYQEQAKLQDVLGQIPSIFMPCCFQLINRPCSVNSIQSVSCWSI
jgi:hypothetical protein